MQLEPEFEISVIVPCLNEEKCLPSFLNSLDDQLLYPILWIGCSQHFTPHILLSDLPPFELIILDGGSTDGSRKIVDSFRDKMPLTGLINLRKNLGYVRNLGARIARGKLLFFSNSDVILPSTCLIKVITEFNKHPDLIALSGRTIPIDGGSLSTVAYIAFDFLRLLFSRVQRFSPSGNFLVVKASVFQDLGGFKNLRVNEDGELGSRIVKKGKIKFCWNLHLWHHAKRFKRNPFRALLFYLYVFGNFNSLLKRILQPIEQKSSREF